MRQEFTLDPNIIHHIIHSQAGSIGKALIELVMNSMDAKANHIELQVTQSSFTCIDDGLGFASKEEVIAYFGRFGTPHQEGDATFGRFRLGRGQIMAHASTVWRSQHWQMTVDTKTMGYAYDLEEMRLPVTGCTIEGEWYESLPQSEWLDLLQEIRDLVRYTPVPVFLNGMQINRLPQKESWDYEDAFAWYRVREEGSVAIFNQGVLVRHDSSHIWGAGGVIISKEALGLNVSRTEILRKTDPVWKHIQPVFQKLADKVSRSERRNTESWRTHAARLLVSGASENLYELFCKAPVITVLPGKRHLTIPDFLRSCHVKGESEKFTIVQHAADIPLAEGIAFSKAATVLHPINLDRFLCSSSLDFLESLYRVIHNILELDSTQDSRLRWDQGYLRNLSPLKVADFDLLKKHFRDEVSLISEKDLPKETLRAWRPAKRALEGYACLCAGGSLYNDLRPAYGEANKPYRFRIFCGRSSRAEAWTDGKSYIAIDVRQMESLPSHPLQTLQKLFSLVEHEVAHKGDSIGAGHDLSFYERFHEINQTYAPYRHRFVQFFLRRYNMALARATKRKEGTAAGEVKKYLVQEERVERNNYLLGMENPIDTEAPAAFAQEEETVDVFLQTENLRLQELLDMRALETSTDEPIDWAALREKMLERQREWDEMDEMFQCEEAAAETVCMEQEQLDAALRSEDDDLLRDWVVEQLCLDDLAKEDITKPMLSWLRNAVRGLSICEAQHALRTAWHGTDQDSEYYRPWLCIKKD